jgi:hypothetical protein
MNKREAKRDACRTVARLIREHLTLPDDDPDPDAVRLDAALWELYDEMQRRGTEPPTTPEGTDHG